MIVREKIAELNCALVGHEPGVTPHLVCVLCHGFGAPGEDLVPLGAEFFQRSPALNGRLLCVFPEAPLSLAAQGLPDGRAWWHIDMMKLQRAVEFGEYRDLRDAAPVGLDIAREKLNGVVNELTALTGVPNSQIVLGGFSQGSMLATDLTLELEEKPAGLIVYSGTLLNAESWRSKAPACKGLPILQSHGRSDPLLPFQLAEELRDMFQSAGADVEFHSFPGQHTIPNIAFEATVRFLKKLLDQVEKT